MRAKVSTLPLLVPGIGADHHGAPMPLDHAAALTHWLDGRANFHRGSFFWFSSYLSAVAERDPAAREVVRGQLDLDPVTGEDADVVLAHLPGDRREDCVTLVELHPEHRARERLDDLAFDLDLLFLDGQPLLVRTRFCDVRQFPAARRNHRAAGRLL